MTLLIRFAARALPATALLCALLSPRLAPGDTIEMRDGTLVKGKYTGGTAGTVRIETAQGIQVVETAKVLAITFDAAPATGPAAAPATAPAAAPAAVPAAQAVPAAAPAAAAAPVMVPAGTVLTIRVTSPVSSKDPPGTKFTGTLLADLTAGTATIAKAGATVHGQAETAKQAGRLAGKSELALTLTGVDLAGKIQPIMTTNFAEAGKGEFRKTARNATAGALVGHAIDDDGGAGAGAAVGAGVSLIKKGDDVTVPPGAFLEFRLTQPFQATPR